MFMQFLKFGVVTLLAVRIGNRALRLSAGKFQDFRWQEQSLAVQFWNDKRRGRGITFRIPIQDRLRFVLRRESRFDRVAKQLGIASEWQTGDGGFDEKVFILCEDLAFNRALAQDAELRELCRKLMGSAERAEIECRAGWLYLGFDAQGLEADDTSRLATKFPGKLAALLKLRDCLQRIRAAEWSEERDPALARKAWLVGISLALGVAGFAAVLVDFPSDARQVVRHMIPWLSTYATIGVVGSLLFAAICWLRSTPHTHAVLLDILLVAAPGCWMAANGALTLYNEKMDRSTPRVVPVEVWYTEKVKRRRGVRYFLFAERWPDPRGQLRMRIGEDEYHWMKAGTCMTAIWHTGRLGDGWVSGYRKGCPDEADVER